MTREQLGDLGEFLVGLRLRAHFSFVDRPTELNCGDLIVENTTKVEVKTSRINKSGVFKFTLWKRGHTNHRDSDYVVLVLLNGGLEYYVIPSDVIVSKQIKISKNYSGKYSQYKDRWDLLYGRTK